MNPPKIEEYGYAIDRALEIITTGGPDAETEAEAIEFIYKVLPPQRLQKMVTTPIPERFRRPS